MHLLREFLASGTLGPVAIGLSPVEVQHILGDPWDVGGTPKQRIWKYGSIQLGFQRDKATRTEALSFIGLYFRSGSLVLPEPIQSEGWFPSRQTTKEDFIRYLKEQGIGYAEDRQLTFETQSALVTESGAHVIFDISAGEVALDSIQLLQDPKQGLREAFETAKQFFCCNTNRGAEPGGNELEQRMHKRECAAVWIPFNRRGDMEKVNPRALIFMYANGTGIIGIGRAKEKCKILYGDDTDRIRKQEEGGHEQEWRIGVEWLAWNEEKPYYQKNMVKPPLNLTFVDITDNEYQTLREAVERHFLDEQGKMTGTFPERKSS